MKADTKSSQFKCSLVQFIRNGSFNSLFPEYCVSCILSTALSLPYRLPVFRKKVCRSIYRYLNISGCYKNSAPAEIKKKVWTLNITLLLTQPLYINSLWMISFLCLLEGDIFSHNLWWDHSELVDHSNCCMSFCSLQIRSTGGISCFSFSFLFFFSYFSLAEQLKKDKAEIFPECCIVPCPAWCAEEAGREDKKSCWTWLLCHPTAQKTEGQQRPGLQNSETGGGRAVNLSSTSLKNSCCSVFLFLFRKVLFTVRKAFYKYSVFIICLELIWYAELRSIKWEKGEKIPKDKRNRELCVPE